MADLNIRLALRARRTRRRRHTSTPHTLVADKVSLKEDTLVPTDQVSHHRRLPRLLNSHFMRLPGRQIHHVGAETRGLLQGTSKARLLEAGVENRRKPLNLPLNIRGLVRMAQVPPRLVRQLDSGLPPLLRSNHILA